MRLPEYVHEANVAGLEQANAKPVKKTPRPDNCPEPAWIAQRIRELDGNLSAQEALFYALPLEVQDEVWKHLA
jgi:hypothetical protein